MKELNDLKPDFEKISELLDKIPVPEAIRENLNRLKGLIIEHRSPRIAVIGRRGSGKTSLLNALIGDSEFCKTGVTDTTLDDQWFSVNLDGCGLDWLDTPGTGAGGKKEERLAKLSQSIEEKKPDAIILMLKADEVDSEIDATLDDLRTIVSITKYEGRTAPVLAIVSQVDKLPPPTNHKPPYKERKKENIRVVVKKAEEHLKRHHLEVISIIPVAAYFDEDDDLRYNIGKLSEILGRSLPEIARLEAARAFKEAVELRNSIVRTIIHLSAGTAGGIGAIPIPVADIVPLTAIQVTMILSIAYLGGSKIDAADAGKFLASMGAAVAAGVGLRALVRMVPFAGWAASATVAAAGTEAMGFAASAVYVDNKSLKEAKKIFREHGKGV